MFPPDLLTWIGWPGTRPVPKLLATHIKEIWIEDVYRVHNLNLEGKLVIDLGAAEGAFSLWCTENGAEVLAIEPDNELHDQLWRNANFAYRDFYDSGEQGPVYFLKAAVTDFACRGRMIQTDGVPVFSQGYGAIPGDTLAHFVEEFLQDPSDRIEILKCDIEGYEWLVFSDETFEKVVPRCNHLSIEWHGEGFQFWHLGNLGNLLERLSETHSFEVIGNSRNGGGYIYAHV